MLNSHTPKCVESICVWAYIEIQLEWRGEQPPNMWRNRALLLPSSELPPEFIPIRDELELWEQEQSNETFGEDPLLKRRKHRDPFGTMHWRRKPRWENKSPFKYENGKYIP